jgi:hypothetical protein
MPLITLPLFAAIIVSIAFAISPLLTLFHYWYFIIWRTKRPADTLLILFSTLPGLLIIISFSFHYFDIIFIFSLLFLRRHYWPLLSLLISAAFLHFHYWYFISIHYAWWHYWLLLFLSSLIAIFISMLITPLFRLIHLIFRYFIIDDTPLRH